MKRLMAFVAGIIIGGAALVPMRLLLPGAPLSAGTVSGSIWRASLDDAAIGNARLGRIDLGLMPGALVQGRLQWQMAGAINGLVYHGASGGGGEGLNGTLPGNALAGLPLAAITLNDMGVLVDVDGRCRSASGQVSATLAVALAGQTSLQGAPRCEAAVLLLPMASPDGRVRLDLRMAPGGWQARLALAGAAPAEAIALAAAGFGRSNGEMVLDRKETW